MAEKRELHEVFLRHCKLVADDENYEIYNSSLALLLSDIDCNFGVGCISTDKMNQNDNILSIATMSIPIYVKHKPGDRVFNNNFTHIFSICLRGAIDFTGGTVKYLYDCDEHKIAEFDHIEYIDHKLYKPEQRNVSGVIIPHSKHAPKYKKLGLNVMVESECYPPKYSAGIKFDTIICTNIEHLGDILALNPNEIKFKCKVKDDEYLNMILNAKLRIITIKNANHSVIKKIFNLSKIPIIEYSYNKFDVEKYARQQAAENKNVIAYAFINSIICFRCNLLRNPCVPMKSARKV